jgi:hypothetical protein
LEGLRSAWRLPRILSRVDLISSQLLAVGRVCLRRSRCLFKPVVKRLPEALFVVLQMSRFLEAHMIRLRGADTVIVGIQPDVAFAMVPLGASPTSTRS